MRPSFFLLYFENRSVMEEYFYLFLGLGQFSIEKVVVNGV